MNSKEKKPDFQQKSILNFFSSNSNNNKNKRTHSEMLKGEIDLTITTPLKQAKDEPDVYNNKVNNYFKLSAKIIFIIKMII